MFIEHLKLVNHLSLTDKQTLVDLLMHIVSVDGQLDAKEMEYLLQVSTKLGMSMKTAKDNISVEELCAKVDVYESKVIILLELIYVACVDDDFCQAEKNMIRDVVQYMGLGWETHLSVERWVKEGITWLNNGEKLLIQKN